MNRTPLSPEARERASDPAILEMARVLARYSARRYRAPLDVMESAAMMGVVKAARSFDPGRGYSFRTFAAYRVRGEMADEARVWSGSRREDRGRKLSIDRPIHVGRDRPVLARDLIDSGEEPVGSGLEFHDLVEHLTRDIPTNEKRVVRALYTEARCHNQKAATGAFGVGRTRVSDLHKRGIAAIRERLAGGGGS